MALPLLAGRAFGDNDGAGQPQVMLINRSLARSGFFGEQPLGKQIYALPVPGKSSALSTMFVSRA